MKKEGVERFKQLDGLRGVAALVVVMHHLACAFYPAIVFGSLAQTHHASERFIYATPLLNLLVAGNFSVTIFFVLSGFVLASSFFRTGDLTGLQSLALRRYPRLMIPVLGSVLLGFLLLKENLLFHFLIIEQTFSTLWLDTFFYFKPVLQDALYQGIWGSFIDPGQWGYNHVIWSMYYEFLGSFLVFSFLGLFGKFSRRYLVYLGLILVFWKSYFLGFLLGVLLADLWSLNIAFSKKGLSVGLLLGLLLGSYPMYDLSGTVYQYLKLPLLNSLEQMVFYHTIGAFLVVLSVLHLGWLSRLLSKKVFLFLGRISFSLYLLHTLVIFSASSLIFYIAYEFVSYDGAVGISGVVSLLLMVLWADIYEALVDQTGMKLADRLARLVMREEISHQK